MDSNTPNTNAAADAAADHAANTDAAIWGALAKMGGLAPRVSPVATPMGRPETISETGARLAREDAAKKGQQPPVHQTGTRPVPQQTQQDADISGQKVEQQQEQEQQQQPAEGHQLQAPERQGDSWDNEVRSFAAVAPDMGLDQDMSQRLLDLVAEQAPRAASDLMENAQGGGRQWNQQAVLRELKTEWGASFDQQMQHVEAAVKRGGEKFADFLDNTGAGNSPVVLRILAAVGKDPSVLDKSKASARLDAVMDNPKYWAGDRSLYFEALLLRAVSTPRR